MQRTSGVFLRPPAEHARAAWPMVRGRSDDSLFVVIIGLLGFGVVMMFSASYAFAEARYEDPLHCLVQQSISAVVGVAVLGALERVDYHHYRRLAQPLLLLVAGLLVLVLCCGVRAGGAVRWLRLGAVSVQPAELAKVGLIVWLASALSQGARHARVLAVGYGVAALVVLERDLGTPVFMVALAHILACVAGARWRTLLVSATLGLLAAVSLVACFPHRWQRIVAWWGPPVPGALDQLAQSLAAIRRGGFFGVGLGNGEQKLLRLAEAQTDFVAAILVEELGWSSLLGLILAYGWIVGRGLRAAVRAPDALGQYLALGISSLIALSVLTNCAVVVGLLPCKGLPLCGISLGGSSLVSTCAACGILLNVSRPRAGLVVA